MAVPAFIHTQRTERHKREMCVVFGTRAVVLLGSPSYGMVGALDGL